jgi:hypothetical protein
MVTTWLLSRDQHVSTPEGAYSQFHPGAARDFQVAADGSRVVFLRSSAGDNPLTALWVYDVANDEERLVADPCDLVARAGSAEHLSPDAPITASATSELTLKARTAPSTTDRRCSRITGPYSGRCC